MAGAPDCGRAGVVLDIYAVARVLGGQVIRPARVLVPGPGHSTQDRSLSVWFGPNFPEGFLTHSFAGDDPLACRDHVRAKLGWHQFKGPDSSPMPAQKPHHGGNGDNSLRQFVKARWLWRQRKPPEGSLVETYLRQVRNYFGPIPSTIGYLPARGEDPPAMIAAFGIPDEPEPGKLGSIRNVRGVHLTRLKTNGIGKAGTDHDRIMIGPSGGQPIVLAPMNDLLGIAICEGIETGLSLHEATGCGVWAAASASRMPALSGAIPEYVDCVTVMREADEAGRKGANELARRLYRRGIHVELRELGGGHDHGCE